MKRLVANFPLLKLDFELIRRHDSVDVGSITQIGETSASTGVHTDMWIARVVLGYGNDQLPEWKKRIPWTTFVVEGEDGRLVWFWRGSVKRLCENKEMLIGLGVKRGETLKVTFACEEVVGTMVRHSVQVG
jgi:ATP-dependent DNA helicase HFM1/MER3